MTDEAMARVTRALRARERAETRLEAARAELHAAIVAALSAGVKQIDLARKTGYSRERIRQLANAPRSPAS